MNVSSDTTKHPKPSFLHKGFEKFSWLPLLILESFTMLFYWASLKYPFQFDDVAHITKHFAIRHDNPLVRWWYNRRWIGDYFNCVDFKLGKFDPFVYRATNLAVHMLCGVLIYYLVLEFCSILENSFTKQYRYFIATCATGLFLLHPLQTQAVSYVIQARIEGIASFFILLNLFLFVRYARASQAIAKYIYLGLLIVATVLSCGSKEIFVLAPVFMFLIDLFILHKGSLAGLLKERKNFYIFYGSFFVMLVCWYVLDFSRILQSKMMPDVGGVVSSYFHNNNNLGNVLTHDPREKITSFSFFISQFRATMHYIGLVFWPFGMSVEYDWKLARGFITPEVIWPLGQLLALSAIMLYSLLRRQFFLIGFGLLWFFVALSPRSTFIPSAELVCDYKSYFAMIGIYIVLAVLCAALVDWLYKKTAAMTQYQNHWASYAFLLVVLLPLGLASYDRNKIWSTPELFWADCVKKAPGKARVHNNYGVALCEVGKFQEAIGHYNTAIALDAHYQDPLSNIAVAYSMSGRPDEAVNALKRAIRLCPNYPEAYNNIASLYIDKKEYDKAEFALNRAIKLRPYYGKAYFNLARVCEARNDMQGVFDNLKKASEGDLDNVADVYAKLGMISFKMKKHDEAVQAFRRAVQLQPDAPLTWFNYANALHLTGSHDEACQIFQKLYAQYPNDYRYGNNLAESFFALKDYDKALGVFQQLLKGERVQPQLILRVANCYEQLKKPDEAKAFLAQIELDNAPEQFQKFVKQEMMRLDLQSAASKTGQVSLHDIQKFSELAASKPAVQEAAPTNQTKKQA